MKYNLFLFNITFVIILFVGCDYENVKNSDKVIVKDTVTDFNGNVYKFKEIGSQLWITENLKATSYQNGDPIPKVTSDKKWPNLKKGAYCSYDNDEKNSKIYGYLYNWYAANDNRNICPTGWHVPTDKDWYILEKTLGGIRETLESEEFDYKYSDIGGKLKAKGTTLWTSPNTGATNETGFSALPGGARDFDADFLTINNYGFWWSSTEANSISAWNRSLLYDGIFFTRGNAYKTIGNSVRCVCDKTFTNNKTSENSELDQIYKKYLKCGKKRQLWQQSDCFKECEEEVGELIKAAKTTEGKQAILDNWTNMKQGN